jgi:hypothetical protein
MGTLFGYMLGLGDGEHRAQLERQRADEAASRSQSHQHELAMVAALQIRQIAEERDEAIEQRDEAIEQRDEAIAQTRKLARQRDAYRKRFLEERVLRRGFQRFTLAAKQVFAEHGITKDTSDDAAKPVIFPVMDRFEKEQFAELDRLDKRIDDWAPVEE